MKIPNAARERASTLVVVIMILATLMTVVAIAFDYTSVVGRNVQRSNTLESAVSIGDGCLDILFAHWRKICRANNGTGGSAPATNAFSSIPLPTSSPAAFPNIAGLTATRTDYYGAGNTPPAGASISNYKVVALDADWQPMASPSASPSPAVGQTRASGSGSAALMTTDAAFSYLASADVTLPSIKGNLVAKVRRIFQKKQESPWNWAIFYVDPLEIHPGPQFTVTGWVHTNSDLYTAHDTLTFADKVTFANNWYVDFMPGDGKHPNETPASPNYATGLPPARDVEHEPFGFDYASFTFNTSDANPNNDSYHELIEPPNTSYTDPLTSQRYFNTADVIVQVSDVSGSPHVKIGTPNGSGGVNWVTSGSLYNTFNNALSVTNSTTIQDNREGASVRVVTLDVGALENGSGTAWKGTGGVFNGLVYIYDTSATTANRRGVRIKNGNLIPSTGLTVASANPVYLQGDFNTGSGTPPSNNATSDPTQPTVSGYNRAPCAIVGDAVNILSNAWNDTSSTASLGTRAATNTTINAAIISGIIPTNFYNDNGYSGGAENFPRFLEDWSNAKFTYYGSMVELYTSNQAVGEWGKANVYNPPTRQWYYDTKFNVSAPPGTIMTISYLKSRWYLEQ